MLEFLTHTFRIEVEDDSIVNPVVSLCPIVTSCNLSAVLKLYSSVKGVRSTPENEGSFPLCGLNGEHFFFFPCTLIVRIS